MNDSITITVNRSLRITVDLVDGDLVQKRWSAARTGRQQTHYAYRSEGPRTGRKYFMLHRVIFSRIVGRPLNRNEIVDHIDGDGLNNRRANLRLVTSAMNNANRNRHDRRNSTGFRGVLKTKRGRFIAQATFQKRHVHLGTFDTALQAAAVVDEWRRDNMPGYVGAINADL